MEPFFEFYHNPKRRLFTALKLKKFLDTNFFLTNKDFHVMILSIWPHEDIVIKKSLTVEKAPSITSKYEFFYE